LNVFWLKVPCNTLKQPFEAIYLSIVVVFERKHEIQLPAFELSVVLDSKVAGGDSKAMQQVVWVIFKTLLHEVFDWSHLVSIGCFIIRSKSLVSQKLSIECFSLGEIINETLWYLFKTITAESDEDVICLHLDFWVICQDFDVLKNTSHGQFKFFNVFIVHSDAYKKLGFGAICLMMPLDLANQAVAKDRPDLSVLEESTWDEVRSLLISLDQTKGLIVNSV
jgi:hypothetical protein